LKSNVEVYASTQNRNQKIPF